MLLRQLIFLNKKGGRIMTPKEATEKIFEMSCWPYDNFSTRTLEIINQVAAAAKRDVLTKAAEKADNIAGEFDSYDAKDTATVFRHYAEELRTLVREVKP